MKGTTKTPRPTVTPRPEIRTMKTMPGDVEHHEKLLRRTTNHNVHVITPHGKIHLGRKGRNG